ncbi:Glycoside hydrolase family 13 protein [Mycena sanguinolenta]|uniref:Glycoside hydrolase family 13 protein n=1 Tax=Mycena sanguinolenta TaxID=230812 RepID=A0A8H7DJR4_9AGAR|nr:Glycoside hydrolase family 13 protein [Mycena sanguinolenta]
MLVKTWLSGHLSSPPALPRMRLGPEGNPDNPLMLQFFTWDTLNPSGMSLWKHLECEIPHLAAMGFTQVWIPPPNKAAQPEGRGYDAYDLWDLGEFDQKGKLAHAIQFEGAIKTRWGTRDELLQACRMATAHGIDIIIDAVLNVVHKLGADRLEKLDAVPVDPQNRLKNAGPVREIDGWTAFDFKGRGNKYSSFQWTKHHFTGLDWDHRTRTQAVYKIADKGRKGWSKYVAKELGNYDYLLGVDIDHRHPEVQKDLLTWGVWILETTGAVGFRLDAIKHFDRRFLFHFITHVRRQSEKPRMFSVSEYWSADLKLIMPYIKAFRGETAFFDVPLHNNFHVASRNHSQYDLRTILNNTIVKARPNDAVTFVDNHEGTNSTVIGQSLESWVDTNFKIQAYSLILLRPNGHPCVFYGDLYPNDEGYNAEISRDLKLLIEARKKFAYGLCYDYFKDPKCIGFVRTGDSLHPGCVVLLSNKEDPTGSFTHTVRMFVGREHARSVFRAFLSPQDSINIDANGWGEFACPSNRVQVWVRA